MSNKSDATCCVEANYRTHFGQLMAIIDTDLRKLAHDPVELLTRMIQPTIWLLVFGQAMARISRIPTGPQSYLDFIAPGILAQSMLVIAVFFGIGLIWERDMGLLPKLLVSPAPRWILVIGRGICGGIRAVTQMVIIYVLCWLLDIHLRWELFPLLGLISMVFLGGALFSTFSLIAACIVKKRERFMGVGQALTMPLFFASNSLYPIHLMPTWLQFLSLINPLSYQVDAMRYLMIVDETTRFGLVFDFGIVLIMWALLTQIASRVYPRILY